MSLQIDSHKLTTRIVIAMFLGIILGLIIHMWGLSTWLETFFVDSLLVLLGKVFIASLKMLVVPLVFISLVCGVCGLDDVGKLGSLGGKTLFFYILTTAIAISLAILCSLIVAPGVGFDLPSQVEFTSAQAPSLLDVLVAIVPKNPIQAAAEGNMLQIIFFALLFGAALSLAGEKAKNILSFFESLNLIIMNMVIMLMHLAPFGVFALICKIFVKQGLSAILPLASYFCLVLMVLMLHFFVTFSILLKCIARVSPLVFFRKMHSTILFALSTSSSNTTLPFTLRTVTEKLGVKRSIASFTVPLGATINMDGTAIMQGVATVFIAQAYSIEMSVTSYLMVIISATLASIGTAGVPGVGLITLAMVLKQVGLPVEGIGLIIGVDRLLDMVRTGINVGGDAMVSVIVAKSEGALDKKLYLENS